MLYSYFSYCHVKYIKISKYFDYNIIQKKYILKYVLYEKIIKTTFKIVVNKKKKVNTKTLVRKVKIKLIYLDKWKGIKQSINNPTLHLTHIVLTIISSTLFFFSLSV